ncbi:MAG: hypothetical protein ACXQTS_07355 [Candidatus Methanospirareceae archaeon]
MKISTVVIMVLIALFLLLPILAGYASIPRGLSPGDIGDFVHGIINYWIIMLRHAFF